MPASHVGSPTPVTDTRNAEERPLLVVVIGPTAVGKTARAIELAQSLGCEIVNADSRQVYQGMPIGTAQPTEAERAAVPHHFVDFVAPDALYSAGQFETDALRWLDGWFEDHRCAVLAGGSGLYVKAVLDGLDPMPADLGIRTQLNERLAAEGLLPLVEELKRLDPDHAARMDTQNPQRVIRALEVCLTSGKPFSSFHSEAKVDRPFDTLVIGLKMERNALIERIDRRVDAMLAEGLEGEVESLRPHWGANALQTVGYREWLPYFNGERSREEVAEEIKLRTRQFAKRQMTWFQKMDNVQWFHPEDTENIMRTLSVECERRGWALDASTLNSHGE